MFDMYKTENISAGPATVLVIQSLVALLGLPPSIESVDPLICRLESL